MTPFHDGPFFYDDSTQSTVPSPLTSIFLSTKQTYEEDFLLQKGYRFVRKLANSLQGYVILVESLQFPKAKFAIKLVDKGVYAQRMAVQSEDADVEGFCEFVDEDILSEAQILKDLTINYDFGHFAKFVDCFESTMSYFLVTEFIEGLTLGEFAKRGCALVRGGRLSCEKWMTAVKDVMSQLTEGVDWLHSVYGCCHLDLCADNVIIENADFPTERDGRRVHCFVASDIKVKFIDFGAAERFDLIREQSFSCSKSQITIDNGAYVAPEVMNGAVYDARKADSWALGILMFRLLTDAVPFEVADIFNESNGYAALKNDDFAQWLRNSALVPPLTKSASTLLVSLLQFDADCRPLAFEAVRAAYSELNPLATEFCPSAMDAKMEIDV